jgi:hypothetical protein
MSSRRRDQIWPTINEDTVFVRGEASTQSDDSGDEEGPRFGLGRIRRKRATERARDDSPPDLSLTFHGILTKSGEVRIYQWISPTENALPMRLIEPSREERKAVRVLTKFRKADAKFRNLTVEYVENVRPRKGIGPLVGIKYPDKPRVPNLNDLLSYARQERSVLPNDACVYILQQVGLPSPSYGFCVNTKLQRPDPRGT